MIIVVAVFRSVHVARDDYEAIPCLVVRLSGFFRRNRSERDLVADIEKSFRMHIEDNLRAVMSTSEARREHL